MHTHSPIPASRRSLHESIGGLAMNIGNARTLASQLAATGDELAPPAPAADSAAAAVAAAST